MQAILKDFPFVESNNHFINGEGSWFEFLRGKSHLNLDNFSVPVPLYTQSAHTEYTHTHTHAHMHIFKVIQILFCCLLVDVYIKSVIDHPITTL